MSANIKEVSIYCGSSYGHDMGIVDAVKDMGRRLGQHTELIRYGGGMYGHLQDIMDSCGDAGGKMQAISCPAYFKEGVDYPDHVDVIKSKNDEDRIDMFLKSDAFVVTPGGDGTFAEAMFSHNRNISALFQGVAQKPVVFLNTNGFYDFLKLHFDHIKSAGYSNDERQNELHFAETPSDVIDILWPSNY